MTFAITNDDQLQVTKEEIEKFSEALASLEGDKAGLHPNYYLAMRSALESQRTDLEEQVRVYQTVVAGRSAG